MLQGRIFKPGVVNIYPCNPKRILLNEIEFSMMKYTMVSKIPWDIECTKTLISLLDFFVFY